VEWKSEDLTGGESGDDEDDELACLKRDEVGGE